MNIAAHVQVDRARLPRADWSLKVTPPYMAPRSKLEREVQLLWQTVLNQPAMISVEADFTQQGGGMMHAVVVNGIIRCAPDSRLQAETSGRSHRPASIRKRSHRLSTEPHQLSIECLHWKCIESEEQTACIAVHSRMLKPLPWHTGSGWGLACLP